MEAALAVAGGCVAVSESGQDAAQVVGHDCIGLVPDAWTVRDREYTPLGTAGRDKVTAYLSRGCSGWSGARRVNRDRLETLIMLRLQPSICVSRCEYCGWEDIARGEHAGECPRCARTLIIPRWISSPAVETLAAVLGVEV